MGPDDGWLNVTALTIKTTIASTAPVTIRRRRRNVALVGRLRRRHPGPTFTGD
jgi:hypothetical protein